MVKQAMRNRGSSNWTFEMAITNIISATIPKKKPMGNRRYVNTLKIVSSVRFNAMFFIEGLSYQIRCFQPE
jgi:hypothetical protein